MSRDSFAGVSLGQYIRPLAPPRLKSLAGKIKKTANGPGSALAAKRGETSKSSLKGASKQMADSMSEKQLKDFAQTKRKKLPTKKN